MSGVLLVGDVIDDVVVLPSGPVEPDTDTPSRIERVAGGSAANTACWLAAGGTDATMVGTVGAEDLPRHIALLDAHGVRPVLTASRRPTGTIVVLSQAGRRAMLTDRGASTETAPEQVDGALLTAHRHLHVAGHVLTGEDRDDRWRALLRRARDAGLARSVAPGSAGLLPGYGAARFRTLVAGVEVLPTGLDEARLLTGEHDGEAAARALGGDHPTVVVTLGADGALVVADGAVEHVPAVEAEEVDPTGAGDAFLAGLLAALLRGAGPLGAAREGAALAAVAVGVPGGRPR